MCSSSGGLTYTNLTHKTTVYKPGCLSSPWGKEGARWARCQGQPVGAFPGLNDSFLVSPPVLGLDVHISLASTLSPYRNAA